MPEIKMRPKHQITLPASVVRAANLETDDRMQVEYVNGVILITPRSEKTVKADAMSFAGIGKGLWGDTPKAVSEAIKKISNSWER
jgi:bifunctional DNA-binding transcriptional regulator/antitoxin component of YhaV-PrlF toxin-antitoxin module